MNNNYVNGKNKPITTDANLLSFAKVPPHATEIEEIVLGAIILERDRLDEVVDILHNETCFYNPHHQIIYRAILALHRKLEAIDLVTLTNELRRTNELDNIGGALAITKLTLNVVSSAHVPNHARIILEKYMLRTLINTSGQLLTQAYLPQADAIDLLDQAERTIANIVSDAFSLSYQTAGHYATEVALSIDNLMGDRRITGVPSGISTIDELTGGWQPADQIVIAARPSMGKTALALQLALGAIREGKKVAIFSLEMSANALILRLLSNIAQVDGDKYRRGGLTPTERDKTMEAIKFLKKIPLFIEDSSDMTTQSIRSKARRMKRREGIDLMIIDYLQICGLASRERGMSREQEVSTMSKELKLLAKELEIPQLLLCQLNRDSDKSNRPPVLADLRDSGAIEQNADVVAFISGQRAFDEGAEVTALERTMHIAKNRNGSVEALRLRFNAVTQHFFPESEHLVNTAFTISQPPNGNHFDHTFY